MKAMTLTRTKVWLRGCRVPWKWVYRLENIPDSRFTASEGPKDALLTLAKKYDAPLIDLTKRK